MNFDIQTEYSPLLVVFCLLLGFGYAFLLYHKDKTLNEAYQSRPFLRYLLGGVRLITVSVLAFLLLSPVIRSASKDKEPPIIIFAQDNSESVQLSFGQSENAGEAEKKQYIGSIQEQLLKPLTENYETFSYSFGSQVDSLNFSFTDKETNFSDLFDELNARFINQNVGAIIIASDGIYNKGRAPVYTENSINAPVYTIALGDTTPKKDLILDKVNYNRLVYLGNKFPLEAIIRAQNCDQERTVLQVAKITNTGSVKLFDKTVPINAPYFENKEEILLESKETGIHHYRVSLSQVRNEVSVKNNYQDIFIEVLDNKQKILLIANSPHPDLKTLKSGIEQNENLGVDIRFINELKENIENYSLIIFHQIPGTSDNANFLINKVNSKKIPVLFILGSQTNLNAFNSLQNIVKIRQEFKGLSDVQPKYNETFSLYSINDNTKEAMLNFPPLKAPYGEYTPHPNAKTMFYQKIGTVSTPYPLLIFNNDPEHRAGVLCGEGIWRWQLYNYAENHDHAAINEFISKIIQYLSVKVDRRKFRVINHKNNYMENEPIIFDAELYNETYELTNTPNINMNIYDAEGKEYSYTFLKTDKAYTLNIGMFPIGNYSYTASVNYNNQDLKTSGQFSVSPLRLEHIQTTANHQLLYNLSKQNGGKMYFSDQLQNILQDIRERSDIVPIVHTNYKTESFIDLKWIFFLIAGLLSVEWFIRKLSGGI